MPVLFPSGFWNSRFHRSGPTAAKNPVPSKCRTSCIVQSASKLPTLNLAWMSECQSFYAEKLQNMHFLVSKVAGSMRFFAMFKDGSYCNRGLAAAPAVCPMDDIAVRALYAIQSMSKLCLSKAAPFEETTVSSMRHIPNKQIGCDTHRVVATRPYWLRHLVARAAFVNAAKFRYYRALRPMWKYVRITS